LTDEGTDDDFDKHMVGFTSKIVSTIVTDPSLWPLFGPHIPQFEVKKDLQSGHMGIISTERFEETDTKTKDVTQYLPRKIKVYSRTVIGHPEV
jgi:hypothetical protein